MARVSAGTIRSWRPLRGADLRPGEAWRDAVLAIPIAFVQVVGSFGASGGQPEREPLDTLAIVLLLLGPAALVVRRRYPVAALAVVLSTTLLYLVLGYPYGPVIFSA